MLDDWEENLAVITANRTKDDELVLIHLGDCLWKERSDVCSSKFLLEVFLFLFLKLPSSLLSSCLIAESSSQIIAAHICYLVAEASFEPFSDTARLCLVGADHFRFPRTYASPEAIQVWPLLSFWADNFFLLVLILNYLGY